MKKPSFSKVRLHFCFEPGEKHWYGATATTAMTHIVIQEWLDSKPLDWMEQVSDEQYEGKS